MASQFPDIPGKILIYHGNSDGSLDFGSQFAAGVRFTSLDVSDFNRDGILDLAVAADTVSIHFGNSDGTFGPPRTPLDLFPLRLGTGDFNNDGRPDLAVNGVRS